MDSEDRTLARVRLARGEAGATLTVRVEAVGEALARVMSVHHYPELGVRDERRSSEDLPLHLAAEALRLTVRQAVGVGWERIDDVPTAANLERAHARQQGAARVATPPAALAEVLFA